MGWKIAETFKFEATRQLPIRNGKASEPHSHSWEMKIVCSAQMLDTMLEAADIKAAVMPMYDCDLNHQHLNDTTGIHNPTSAALARWVYDQLKDVLPLVEVVIYESSTSECSYTPLGYAYNARDAEAARTSLAGRAIPL
jgi:6-pyruvoyltetrahydropterin/6-carboxytetrahydropterin synthase